MRTEGELGVGAAVELLGNEAYEGEWTVTDTVKVIQAIMGPTPSRPRGQEPLPTFRLFCLDGNQPRPNVRPMNT